MNHMRKCCFGLGFILAALFSFTVQAADVPPEVMTAYKAYNSSLKAKDKTAALKHAKRAWIKSEQLVGDNKLTGDLAYNYGYLSVAVGDVHSALKPLERATNLAHLSKENANLIRLEREELLISSLMLLKKTEQAKKRAKQAREFAKAAKLDDSVFAAEIMVHQSRLISTRANRVAERPKSGGGSYINTVGLSKRIQASSADFAMEAIKVFDANPDEVRISYKAVAYKLLGFSHERNKEWLEAAIAYQNAMKIYQGMGSKLQDAPYATTVGRWINARNYLKRGDGIEAALEEGLCKCWPYAKESSVRAEPIKRRAPKMPSHATISGYTILQFDLDEGGKVINPKIIHSWPERMYNKSSLRALKSWQYETKANGKLDAQREDIVLTINYFLRDWTGDPV